MLLFIFYVKVLINLGTKNQVFSEQPITRLVNVVGLIGNLIVLLTEVMFIVFIGFQSVSFCLSIFYSILFSGMLYLNFIEKWKWSKRLFVVTSYICVITVHISFQKEVVSWVNIISAFAFYGAFFKDRRETFLYAAGLMLLVVFSIFIQHSSFHHPIMPYDESSLIVYQIVSFVSTSTLVLLVVLFVRSNLLDHQQHLEKTLAERNLLLKEVHHRVKNNLQVVSSLFNLQERRLSPKDKKSREIIQTGQGRIQTMALVHEQLYDSSNLKTIELKAYIEKLVHHLKGMYLEHLQKLNISLNIDKSTLPLELVIIIGLIITESLTNAFKYAFGIDEKGDIVINYFSLKNEHTLIIQDNGIGYDFNSKKHQKGIGIQLIKDMANQLNGTHRIETVNGIKHIINFKMKE